MFQQASHHPLFVTECQSGAEWLMSRSVFLHVGVAQALAKRAARAVRLAARDRIGTIVGRVEGAWPMVARQADPAERRIRRRTIGRLVPVDHTGVNVGPKPVVIRWAVADQAGGES